MFCEQGISLFFILFFDVLGHFVLHFLFYFIFLFRFQFLSFEFFKNLCRKHLLTNSFCFSFQSARARRGLRGVGYVIRDLHLGDLFTDCAFSRSAFPFPLL